MRNRTIQYAIDEATGLVVSRVGSEVAWPVLDWDGMTPENGFKTEYPLERMSVLSVAGERGWNYLTWTRKVPVEIKNEHRRFWGMKPLREDDNAEKKQSRIP